MKKIALAALTGVTLIGCTVERTVIQEPATTPAPDTTTVKTTPAPTRPPTTPAPAADETGFILSVNTNAPITFGIPDSELLSSGWATCDGFADGLNLNDVATAITDSSGGDPEIEDMLSWIAVSAVIYLCPQYSYIMESDY